MGSQLIKILRKVERTLKDNFEIQDWRGVRILLGTAAAHYIPGEPLWLRLIGASRSGRTELLRLLTELEDSVEMESITPAAIRGGLTGGERLLDRINGKRVITKDLAPLITSRRESRLEIFGLLRSVKDGSISSDFGTREGYIFQEVSFDWILAVTPAKESVRQIESLLGERYVDLHWIPGNREEMAFKAACNNPSLPEIREKLSASISLLMSTAKAAAGERITVLSDEERRDIAKYANVIALCRSPVQKDSRGILLAVPKPEIGTSLSQDFSSIALGLKLLGLNDWKPYVERLAWDCIPSIRARLIRSLTYGPKSVPELHEKTGIPQSTIYYHLADLQMLGVVRDEPPCTISENGTLTCNLAQEDSQVKKSLAVTLPPLPKKIRFV